jgi:hypothetical protein
MHSLPLLAIWKLFWKRELASKMRFKFPNNNSVSSSVVLKINKYFLQYDANVFSQLVETSVPSELEFLNNLGARKEPSRNRVIVPARQAT